MKLAARLILTLFLVTTLPSLFDAARARYGRLLGEDGRGAFVTWPFLSGEATHALCVQSLLP